MPLGAFPPALIAAPPYEWPTRMTGPSRRAIARLVAATSSAREVSGFWTATAFRPAFSSSGITLAQLEPSAHAPWTRTIAGLLRCARTGFAKAPIRMSSTAAATRMVMDLLCRARTGILRPLGRACHVVETAISDNVPQKEASGGAAFLIDCGV